MTERLNHKLDTSKLKTIKDIKNVFDTMGLIASLGEDDERYEIAKEYFTIPYVAPELKGTFQLPRKSLEEISQELEEKFEKLIEKTHLEYRIGHNWLYKLRRYEEFCKKQDDDFEYARENGFFPPKLTGTLDYSNLIATGSNITSSFVIRCGTDNAGYYTIGAGNVKYYMKKKPNWLVRNCAKIFFDITWKDK